MPNQFSLADIAQYNSTPFLWGTPTARDQAFLSYLRQYDPNAQFKDMTHANSEWGDDSKFSLQFDPTALPTIGGHTFDFGSQRLLGGAYENRTPGIGAQGAPRQGYGGIGNMINKNLVFNDPHYGKWTPTQNFKQDRGWLDTIGPMIPMLFAAGAPALFGALSGGAIGGASASIPMWMRAASKIPSTLSGLMQGSPSRMTLPVYNNSTQLNQLYNRGRNG